MTKAMITAIRLASVWLLLLVGGTLTEVWGQDAFDPDNPPEPSARFRVTVTSVNGYTSGTGIYASGQAVHISTSAMSQDYTFSHWTLNGERYSSEPSLSYVVSDRSLRFEAVYDFTPVDPAEPQAPNTYRLYLTTNEEGSCSFNRGSGDKAEGGEWVAITVTPSQGYQFRGWYLNGVKQSDSLSFGYCMPRGDTTLEARFVYNPDSPDEPSGDGSQTGNVTKNKQGDVNGDGVADVADAVLIINHSLAGTTGQLDRAVADLNGDGEIDVADVVRLINMCLNNE